MARIVETDNFARDYPDEKFVNIPPIPPAVAEHLCELINSYASGPRAPRY